MFLSISSLDGGSRLWFLTSCLYSLLKYPTSKNYPGLARNTRGLHAWKMKPSRQNLVVFVFVLVFVLLGCRLDASSSFCSSVGRHPVFENRGNSELLYVRIGLRKSMKVGKNFVCVSEFESGLELGFALELEVWSWSRQLLRCVGLYVQY